MGLRVGSTVINCSDIETMTDFWCDALGLVPNHRDAGDDFRVLRGDRVNVSLQVADGPVSARDQMHLDLYSDDMRGEVQRLVELGARYRREESADGEGSTFVVLSDPEGNEFCVCAVSAL